MEVRFVEGLRVSDAETVEVAKMVLLGKINSDILSRLNRHGQPAVGLSAARTAACSRCGRVRDAEQVGFVGEIEQVNVDVIDHIAEDYIPVIASVGTDRDGNSYNVNADEAAGKVAAAMPRLQGDLPHRRARLAAPTRTTRTRASPRPRPTRSGRPSTGSGAACGRSSRPASTRSRGGVEAAHIIDGRRPTPCCSSSSPTPESAPRSRA